MDPALTELFFTAAACASLVILFLASAAGWGKLAIYLAALPQPPLLAACLAAMAYPWAIFIGLLYYQCFKIDLAGQTGRR